MNMINSCTVRRDIMKNWVNGNPIIRENELICVVCMDDGNLVNKYKVGDGKSHYLDLRLLDNIPVTFKIIGNTGGELYINLDGVNAIFSGDKQIINLEKMRQ